MRLVEDMRQKKSYPVSIPETAAEISASNDFNSASAATGSFLQTNTLIIVSLNVTSVWLKTSTRLRYVCNETQRGKTNFWNEPKDSHSGVIMAVINSLCISLTTILSYKITKKLSQMNDEGGSQKNELLLSISQSMTMLLLPSMKSRAYNEWRLSTMIVWSITASNANLSIFHSPVVLSIDERKTRAADKEHRKHIR